MSPLGGTRWRLLNLSATQMIFICYQGLVQPVNSSIDVPVGVKNWGSGDALRVAYNSELMTTEENMLDYSTPVSGEINANGQIPFATGMTTDSIHQNGAGIAAQVVEILKSFPFML